MGFWVHTDRFAYSQEQKKICKRFVMKSSHKWREDESPNRVFVLNLIVSDLPSLYTFITVRQRIAKVMFLQASVCPQGGRWGCLPQCMLGYHTPQSRHPPGSRHPPRSRHPPGADRPGAYTPPGAETPWSRHPPGVDTLPLGVDTPREQTPPEHTPPPRDTVTAADGMHPTGMHSCWMNIVTKVMFN